MIDILLNNKLEDFLSEFGHRLDEAVFQLLTEEYAECMCAARSPPT